MLDRRSGIRRCDSLSGCGFRCENKVGGGAGEWLWLALLQQKLGTLPHPLHLWNHEVRVEMARKI